MLYKKTKRVTNKEINDFAKAINMYRLTDACGQYLSNIKEVLHYRNLSDYNSLAKYVKARNLDYFWTLIVANINKSDFLDLDYLSEKKSGLKENRILVEEFSKIMFTSASNEFLTSLSRKGYGNFIYEEHSNIIKNICNNVTFDETVKPIYLIDLFPLESMNKKAWIDIKCDAASRVCIADKFGIPLKNRKNVELTIYQKIKEFSNGGWGFWRNQKDLESATIAAIKLGLELLPKHIKTARYEFRGAYMSYVIIHKGLTVEFAKFIASEKSSTIGQQIGKILGENISSYENSFELVSQFVKCKNIDMLSGLVRTLDGKLKAALYTNTVVRKRLSHLI